MCTQGVPGGKCSTRVKHIMFLPGDTNVYTGCTRCVPRVFFRRRRRFNDFRPLFLSKICQNLSKFVKKFVKICQNLSKFVKICQKLSKIGPFFQPCTHFYSPWSLDKIHKKHRCAHTVHTRSTKNVVTLCHTTCISRK